LALRPLKLAAGPGLPVNFPRVSPVFEATPSALTISFCLPPSFALGDGVGSCGSGHSGSIRSYFFFIFFFLFYIFFLQTFLTLYLLFFAQFVFINNEFYTFYNFCFPSIRVFLLEEANLTGLQKN
jgi:hypothetical protein